MPFLLDISTSVPRFLTRREDFIGFYKNALKPVDPERFAHKLELLIRKTKIEKRYSCIPDFNGSTQTLFRDENFTPSIKQRMDVYKENILPLAIDAIDGVFQKTKLKPSDITHFITVSCTGLSAPGMEFQLAEHYGLQHTEKFGLYFLGCYAAMKALKQANYIALADPKACVLIVCAELCSLHFNPSDVDEDIVANLLFADGAAAVLVCGDENEHGQNKTVLRIDQMGSAVIPETADLMTWDIGISNFRMHLNKRIASKIGEGVLSVVQDFLGEKMETVNFWAIHPGGIKIVDTVRERLELSEKQVEDSLNVLQNFGNMSSPTILFILSDIFRKIKNQDSGEPEAVFSCAFGPGISIEMIRFSVVSKTPVVDKQTSLQEHAIKV